MKITNISSQSYRWPRKKPITNGKHTYVDSEQSFISIETDEGVTGIGLGRGGKIEAAILEHLKPQLIGEDPINVERIWEKLWVPKLIGRRGLTTRAISAIDIGLWDLRGKVAGMPVYKMLGGYRDRVPTYVAGGYYEEGKGLKELAEEMESNLAMGARAVKMKVGALPLREDAERVKTVRDAVGPDVKVLVDANCAYKWFEAIQFAKRIEEYDIFWFEEPILPDDYEGHKKIAAQTIIPIATGENEYTRYGFRDLVQQGAVAVLNADAQIMGGVTEWMKVAAYAQAHHVDVAPHGKQEIHIHLLSAVPNGLILEFYRDTTNPMWGKTYLETLRINDDGTVSPPEVPGLGTDPNLKELEKYRVL